MRLAFCLSLIFMLTGAVVTSAADLDVKNQRVKRAVCDWAPTALSESMSLSHESFGEDLTAAAVYFTESGKTNFDLAIAGSRIANLVLNTPGSALKAESFGTIRIGKVENLDHWNVSVPLRLTAQPVLIEKSDDSSAEMTEDAAETPLQKPEIQKVMIFAKIRGLPPYEDDRDYAMMRFQILPYLDMDMGKHGLSMDALSDCP